MAGFAHKALQCVKCANVGTCIFIKIIYIDINFKSNFDH